MSVVETIAWIAGTVYSTVPSYWLLVHRNIGYWRSRRTPLSRVGPFWFLLWVLMGTVTWRWRHLAVYRSPWIWIPAGALIAIGLALYWPAVQKFTHDQLVGRPELEPQKHEQRLRRDGIRARVRHPIYLGHLCELAGWTLGTGLVVLMGLTVFAIVTGAVMIRAEERELEARFGEPYREYQRQVPALLPRL
jgi:protein-S-isoprenylcysteine O-methyltransferase Ste14